MESLYDVAIIGGGPAGSTAATFLAKKGHKVIVLEKEKFPRFHIGESLLPYSMGAFERLGVREKLDAKFLIKYGAEISSCCGTNAAKFLFADGYKVAHEYAYQVTRSEFDKVLLDHSAESGATVMEETSVTKLTFEKEGVGVSIKDAAGESEIRAKYLIDCSGRNTVVGNYFKLKKGYPNLKKFSVFAHFENVEREADKPGTFIRLVRGNDRWFWMIPLTETKMSIGVVMNISDFRALKRPPEEALEHFIQEQPLISSRMKNATRVTPVHSESDYSYRNTVFTGDRWMLAGDAAGFIDPIFSTGVFLAIRSGENAATAMDATLRDPRKKAGAFKTYTRGLKRIMDLYLRFVSNWYKPQFGEVITHPVYRLQLAPVVNSVLAGNLSTNFGIWWRMELFYLVVFLQKYIPLCPRISMNAADAAAKLDKANENVVRSEPVKRPVEQEVPV